MKKSRLCFIIASVMSASLAGIAYLFDSSIFPIIFTVLTLLFILDAVESRDIKKE